MRSPAAQIPPAPGDVLAGQYRVEGVLGAGGMGTVYAVVDTASGARLAMKVVDDTSDEEHVTRFFREGRATVRIESEHVVRVYDLGSIDGRLPYMVMERLVGTTLKAMLRDDGPLDDRAVADLMIQACEGLAHAHASGVIHRDVKPSNLFVVDELGGDRLLKILDFGISKVASLEDWERTTTESGAFLGSPYYVSPEQLRNPSRIDPRADVWSLGVTMYNALSGRHPFEGGSLAELLVAVMSGEPTPLAARSRASRAMQAVVARCIERAVDRRFRDVGELAGALAPLASPRWAALAPRIARVAARAAPERPTPPPVTRDDERTTTFDEPPIPRDGARTTTLDDAPAIPRDGARTTTLDDAPAIPRDGARTMTLDDAPAIPRDGARTMTLDDAPAIPRDGARTTTLDDAPLALVPASTRAFDEPPRSRSGAAATGPTSARAPRRTAGLALMLATTLVIVGGAAAFAAARSSSTRAAGAAGDAPPPVALPAPPATDGEATADGTNPPAADEADDEATPPDAPAEARDGETREVTLELNADAPITKVIRPAARRVALEDGRAKVTVAAFHGDLPIDVEIAGGRRAHGVAHAGGPLAVKLTTTKGSAARPHVSPPKAAPRASKELQESPYK